MEASFYHHNGNATKEDVVQIRADMATKDNIKDLERRMATKEDIKNLKWTIGLLVGILIVMTAAILGAPIPLL